MLRTLFTAISGATPPRAMRSHGDRDSRRPEQGLPHLACWGIRPPSSPLRLLPHAGPLLS